MTGQPTPNPKPGQTLPAAPPVVPADAANWAQDVIVIGSIAMTALAGAVMARSQAGAALSEAVSIGLAAFLMLSAIHVIYRRRLARGDAPAAPKAAARPAAQADTRARLPRHAENVPGQPLPDPVPVITLPLPPASAAALREQSAATGEAAAPDTETLQKLIADLARTVPGPKATTPDPDRPAASPTAPAAHVMPTLDTTLEAEARALRAMADTMAEAATAHRSVADIIDEALRTERIATYLEPIQAFDERRARHFEVSIRLRAPDGTELAHDEVEQTALRAGLTPRLDAAKLPRAARIATHLSERGRGYDILSSIAALSITDPAFQDVLAEVFSNHDTPHVVLSFTQDDVRDFAPVHWQALHAISTYGVRFAIESVFDLDLDFEALKGCGFDFVKLDASVLLAGLPSPSGLIPADHICRYLSTLGFAIVVSRLDDEDTLARVMGFGVLMGQGTLFGGRRPVKAEVLTGRAAA